MRKSFELAVVLTVGLVAITVLIGAGRVREVQETSAQNEQLWRHATAEGTRWSPRLGEAGLFLVVDLGDNRIGNIRVPNEFLETDQDGMDRRIDRLKTTLAARVAGPEARFAYHADGTIAPDPL
jgi:hypothetical protein